MGVLHVLNKKCTVAMMPDGLFKPECSSFFISGSLPSIAEECRDDMDTV